MYQPNSAPEDNLEFVEICNLGDAVENLANWRLRGGADFDFTGAQRGLGLNPDGSPTPVERVLIRPPESRIGVLSDVERDEIIKRSPLSLGRLR